MSRLPSGKLWIGTVAECLCIASMARHGNFLQAGEPARFTLLAVAAGAAFWLAVRAFLRAGFSPGTNARWFWTVTVILRLLMLPILPGDDLWRYRWEGTIQLHGFNPYEFAPDCPALVGLRDEGWARISHQNVSAIYPPLAEWLFKWLARGEVKVLGYKLLFACADLGVAGILRRLLGRAGVPPENAAYYAWNPLAIYVGAGAAHFDPLMVLAMMGAIWCLDHHRDSSPPTTRASAWRVPSFVWASAVLLGAAIALKAVPAVLLPVWAFALGWRRALLTLPVTIGLPLAFACLYGFPSVPVFGGLTRFAQGFRVNDAFWWLVDPKERAGGWYGGIAAVVCLALSIWFRRDWRRGTLWVLGAALLLGPAVHAWYVLWVLPIAVWRGGDARAWVVFSVTVFGYYLLWEVNHDSGRPWEEPVWLRMVIYLPPLFTLGWLRYARASPPAEPGESCYH